MWRQDTWWHLCAASRNAPPAALWRFQNTWISRDGVTAVKMSTKVTSYDTAWCGRSASTFRKNIQLPLGKTNDTNRRGTLRTNWRLCAKGVSELERGPAGLWWETTNAKMQNVHTEDMTQETVWSCAVQFGAKLFWSAHIRVAAGRQDDDEETTNQTGGIWTIQTNSNLTQQLFTAQRSLYAQYRRFNIQQLYGRPSQCIYVDLRTNRDYFPIQH